MNIEFLNTYVPQSVELSNKDVLDSRTALLEYVSVSFPDIAHQPGTVLGDLIVTPQSYIIASLEKGIDNFTLDILLDNVANGDIYNCDFVSSYLKNFGVYDVLNKPASGIVRLVFSENKQYILDRGTLFRIGGSIFSLYLPNDGDFYCQTKEDGLEDHKNGCILKDSGSNTWFCDVPVIGNVGDVTITGGLDVDISVYIEQLNLAYTLDNFYGGIILESVTNLAKLAQTTAYSASLNTRMGTVMYVNKFCPFITNVFAIRDGDRELLRSYRNGYGIASGCMDVYMRSQSYQFVEKLQVKVVLDDNGEWLEGEWDYVGLPYHVESVTHPAVDLLDIEDREIISTSDPSLKLGALAAYTKHEKLSLRVKDIKVSTGDSIFDLEIGEDGKLFTYMTITYQTDPMFRYALLTIENTDFAPINTSITARGFIPVIIREFKVVYTRKPGVIPDLDTARDAIKVYMSELGVPNQYSKAEIAKIMSEAGVAYIKDIKVDAYVLWSVGTKIQDYEGNIVSTAVTDIKSDDELRVLYPNIDQDLQSTDMYACTPRILRYFMLENSIKFNEVRDV